MGAPFTEQFDADALRPADPEPARWGLGRVLRLATGVREDVLAHVPSERARYTSMGGVVVGTAVMAMLSMSAAIYSIFGGFQLFMLFAVPVWGMFILSLDRWLMSSTSMSQSGKALRNLLPRLGLSIALGVVLAEPLLLGIYNTAITEKIAHDRKQEVDTRESDLRTCNPVPGTPEAAGGVATSDRCEGLRLSLGGDSPEALQSQLDGLATQRDELKKTVDADAAAYAKLEDLARKECNGTSGDGLTGRYGEGINCKRLRNEADQYRKDHRIDENGAKLAELNRKLAELSDQVGRARNDYAGLLDKAIEEDLAAVRGRQGKIGLLERFRALDELVATNDYVRVTQWAIRIFFILVDALPVLLKALSGTSSYERLLEAKLADQELLQKYRSAEELDRNAHYGDLVRHQTDITFRTQLELMDQDSRITRANLDEQRGALVDALEQHYMRTAIGPSGRGWSGADSALTDAENLEDMPTQELRSENAPGRYS
ncbi:DUF4407 domain-containing protein [Dactylosporangium sucinum]|uniref:DUF4407 domain-containing protein n=1 Tax=Dactylosporangium sucinum TaxID=1424081 RepID=A0A917TP00_9ACTN|nr:DUF4407 domain-containing protein [Dactylosporangium sucinum]GGM27984.1 hypothetical protein GCM10007977_031630 [Dactylosporangium sucinum]